MEGLNEEAYEGERCGSMVAHGAEGEGAKSGGWWRCLTGG